MDAALGQKQTSASCGLDDDLMHRTWVQEQSILLQSAVDCLAGDRLPNCDGVRNTERCDRWRDFLCSDENAGNSHNVWEAIQSKILRAHHSTQRVMLMS